MQNDSPIMRASEDLYGVAPLANAIAIGLRQMRTPEGFVIAVSGPFGSGKSSVINLVCEALGTDSVAPQIIRFTPWWFGGGPEGLTRAFFEELNVALDEGLRGKAKKKAKEALAALWQKVRPYRQSVGVAVDVVSGGTPVGSGAVAVADAAIDLLDGIRSVEDEFERLSSALSRQNKRFLVIIDDVDRLDPHEMIHVFRLVKSIGNLPNVTYIIAFDREIADRHLKFKLSTDANEYLEKIIQKSFELPAPDVDKLRSSLLSGLNSIVKDVITTNLDQSKIYRIQSSIESCIMSWVNKPRQVVRLLNSLRISLPSIHDEVDLADFLVLESLHISHPGVYKAIQMNPSQVCGTSSSHIHTSRTDTSAHYDRILLSSASPQDWDSLKGCLKRLFPRLESVWGNTYYSGDASWRRDRLVCSRAHFSTYFRLTLSPSVLPQDFIRSLRYNIGDASFLIAQMSFESYGGERSVQQNRAEMVLEELRLLASDLSEAEAKLLSQTLGEASVAIASVGQIERPFSLPIDALTIAAWTLGECLRRIDSAHRYAIALETLKKGDALWAVTVSDLCGRYWQPSSEKNDDELFISETELLALNEATLDAIGSDARGDHLINKPHLLRLLSRWASLANDNGSQVKRWIDSKFKDDDAVVRLADAVTGTVWTHALGDPLARRSARLQDNIPYIDLLKLRARAQVVYDLKSHQPGELAILERFLFASSAKSED
jgi:predicted KAP-like P-loop ATPase